ncbi:hypothetical protein ACFQO7_08085 [Catellatospora aurea]|uniref:Uncharacterized protein n=1 Tax=Catellatospora aurea TaxID=1337874 RepID=A0ABW2GU16_9ACTN
MRHAHSPGAHRARRAGLVTAAATAALAVVMTMLLNLTGGVAMAATLFSDNFNSGSATYGSTTTSSGPATTARWT